MGTPKKHSIKENVITTLKTITTANGYNQDVQSDLVVPHRPYLPTDAPAYPALFAFEETDQATNDLLLSMTVKTMLMTVGIWINNNDDPELALDKICADVEKALMVDRTRGGYAIDTELLSVEPEWRPAGIDPTGMAYLTFEISYRHTVGNPF